MFRRAQRRFQFSLRTITIAVAVFCVVLAVMPRPKPSFVEVDGGAYSLPVGNGGGHVCSFCLALVTERPHTLRRRIRLSANGHWREVAIATQSATFEELLDPALGSFKRELLTRINRTVGEELVHKVVFSQYYIHRPSGFDTQRCQSLPPCAENYPLTRIAHSPKGLPPGVDLKEIFRKRGDWAAVVNRCHTITELNAPSAHLRAGM